MYPVFTADEVHAKLTNMQAGIRSGRLTVQKCLEWCEEWMFGGILLYADYLRLVSTLKGMLS